MSRIESFSSRRQRWIVALAVSLGCGGGVSVVSTAEALSPSPVTLTFDAAGPHVQTWTVPAGVTAVTYDVIGADGASLTGYGARVQGTMTVTPGTVLDIWVGLQGQETSDLGKGGAGGWGGQNGMRHGGNGATSQQGASAGGGGGATEIDLHGVAGLSGVLIVAGGGGGVGGRALGAGTTTTCSQSGAGGCGAVLGTGQGVPGTAGLIGAFPGGSGGGGDFGGGTAAVGANPGGPSDSGAGGDGGTPALTASAGAGGGGGGGYGGGGGGGAGGTGSGDPFSQSAGGGGGAGRSIAPPTPARSYNSAAPYHGAGKVTLTYQPPDVPAAPPGATRFVTLAPSRLLDTRLATDQTGGAPVAPNGIIDVQITGRGGVPASNVAAVVVNVTVAAATGPGFVTVWPTGQARPVVSNLNVTAVGQNIANLVTVRLGDGGKISIYAQAGAHFVVDVEGYYEPVTSATAAGRFMTLPPQRILDTRIAVGVPGTVPVAPGGVVDLAVAGHGGVPASGATAVVMNVTAAESTAPGFVTVWPGDGDRPLASTLNVTFAGQNIANLVIVPLGSDGHVHLFSQHGGHLLADVAGWFTGASASASLTGLFVPLAPSRILDTRLPLGVPSAGAVRAGQTIDLTIAGKGGAPASGFVAVVANVTAAEALAPGFVTVWPAGTSLPTVSNLNVTAAGQNIPNLVIVNVGSSGDVSLYSQSGAHLLADLAGYYIGG